MGSGEDFICGSESALGSAQLEMGTATDLWAARARSGASRFSHCAVSELVPPHGLLQDVVPHPH